MKKILALAAATLVIAGLASCTAIRDASVPREETPTPSDTLEAPEPSFAEQPEPEPEPVGNLAFGEAVTYVDGLSISVSVPEPFTPSEYVTTPFMHNLAFTITITNGTAENYDGYTFITATSGGSAGESVFDYENGLEGPPSGVILPGQTISFKTGFSVADPTAIVLSVAPGFEYENTIFTNVG